MQNKITTDYLNHFLLADLNQSILVLLDHISLSIDPMTRQKVNFSLLLLAAPIYVA